MNLKEQLLKAIAAHQGQELLFTKLLKGKVFDFKSRQLLHETPAPELNPAQPDPQYAHGNEAALRSIEARGYSPEAMAFYQAHNKNAEEPYFGGDMHNIQYRTMDTHHGKWNEPMPFPAHVGDLKGHLGKYVAQGGPDPLAWIDRKYGVSRKLIEDHKGKPLTISTRSDLIGGDEYIKALDPKHHKVRIHAFSDNDEINRLLEPGAPSFKRRMGAVQRLKEAGIPVQIVHDKVLNAPAHIAAHNRLHQPVGLTNPIELNDEQLARLNSNFATNEGDENVG